ncbi:MAG: hypothetical protein HY048_12995 [Acidobacteria bacterium]|nr:hypothetical protein [Acidobacteriota bacterium]
MGPSFNLVSGWAEQGVPLKVAFAGIDRYFERYYRKGPRRRPVKIDFCEADVLDVFDGWRRATGVTTSHQSPAASHDGDEPPATSHQPPETRHSSLPAHLERVVLRLTSARAGGALDAGTDDVIDQIAAELDAARTKAGGLRGAARQALIDRLTLLDADLLRRARATLDEAARAALMKEAEAELAPFARSMPADALARARELAVDRLVRERFGLPTVAFL